MYSEARKLHFIEKYLKVKDEGLLVKFEEMIKDETDFKEIKKKKPNIFDIAGMITDAEAEEMKKAIAETEMPFNESGKPDIYALLGIMTLEEAEEMEKAIEETAEKIYPDEWK